MEIMKETPRSRIREQNNVDKEFLEVVGNGKPTGSVLKETIVVSVTIFSTEGFQMEMLIRTPSRRVILICVCG